MCAIPQLVSAPLITDEAEADYDKLQNKWKPHLRLGKKTGHPLEELDTMEQEGITRACPKKTGWVHNLVTVVKKDETLSSPMPRSTKFEI